SLARLAMEDPTFKVNVDPETNQTLIHGMGELHLDIIVDRLQREFNIQANVGKPQVAYRETIRQKAEAEGRFVRQTGGRGQYGDVWLEVEPAASGTGVTFENKLKGPAIPREYVPAVEKGIKEAAETGVLAGYPVVDIKVSLTDGSYHDVDSSEMAFKIAASIGFKEGCRKAKPVLLEPVMDVEVVAPSEYQGAVIGDLNSRRGRIVSQEVRANAQVIRANVPLGQMFGYATDVRSMTQGRATYTMQFARYEEVPKNIAEEIMAKVAGKGTPRAGSRGVASTGEIHHGQGEIRSVEAAREHWDDWAHRPREDDADLGDHEGAAHEVQRGGGAGLRDDRQCPGGAGAGDHDCGEPRGVRDGEAALRAHRLSGARGLHQEHDHGGGADGRGDSRGGGERRADAADAGARAAGAAGER